MVTEGSQALKDFDIRVGSMSCSVISVIRGKMRRWVRRDTTSFSRRKMPRFDMEYVKVIQNLMLRVCFVCTTGSQAEGSCYATTGIPNAKVSLLLVTFSCNVNREGTHIRSVARSL